MFAEDCCFAREMLFSCVMMCVTLRVTFHLSNVIFITTCMHEYIRYLLLNASFKSSVSGSTRFSAWSPTGPHFVDDSR